MKSWIVCGTLLLLGCQILGTLGSASNNRVLDFTCPEITGHYQRVQNCSTFYKCNSWRATVESCYPLTQYNHMILGCDWPEYSGCREDLLKQGIHLSVINIEEFVITDLITCPNNSFCLYPTWFSCSQFFRCVRGIAYLVNCPRDMYYDRIKGICGPKKDVECSITTTVEITTMSRQVTTKKPTTTPEPTTTKKPTTTPKPTTTNKPTTTPKPTTTKKPTTTPESTTTKKPTTTPKPTTTKKPTTTPEPTTTKKPTTTPKPTTTKKPTTTPEPTTTKKPTTTPKPIGFKCPEPCGLFPDPTNCGRYYYCFSGMFFHKWCPSFLHFNSFLQTCDRPETAGCGKDIRPTNMPTSNKTCECLCSFLPDTSDCTKYKFCKDNKLYEMKCPHDFAFNPKTGTCDYSDQVQCKDTRCPKPNGLFPHPDSCLYYIHCENWKVKIMKCPEGLGFDPNSMSCSWPDTCDLNVTKPLIVYPAKKECPCNCCAIADPNDCSKFILCISGNIINKQCVEGLFFNPDTENCDYAKNVNCNRTCDKDCEKPTKPPEIYCRKPFGLFPFPNKHNLFIHCCQSIAQIKECPNFLHFNPLLRICDWPWNVGNSTEEPKLEKPGDTGTCDCDCCIRPIDGDCAGFVRCEGGFIQRGRCSGGLLFNRNLENCDLPENVICHDDLVGIDWECPSRFGLFPHPKDCLKFIQCSHWIPHVMVCPGGLHFNPVKEVCDWSEDAGCNETLPTIKPKPNGKCDLCEYCLIPDNVDCAAFIRCENGKAYKDRCSPGLLFNPKIHNCDYQHNVDCDKPETCPKPCGLFPHKDCARFIRCNLNVAEVKECPTGLHFNSVLKTCDRPDRAGCEQDHNSNLICKDCDCCLVPDKEDCSRYFICESGKSVRTKCGEGLLFEPSVNNCVLEKDASCKMNKFICPIPDGMFKNEDDCGYFWSCNNGKAFLMNCPLGLHWSQALQRCEWPCVARCDPSVPVCPTTSTTVEPTRDPLCPCVECISENPYDCQSYFKCQNGTREKKYCPTGLYFNKNTHLCDYLQNVDCPDVGDPCLCEKPNGKFVLPVDCNKYVECINGVAFIRKCPWNQKFDRFRQTCVSSNDGCDNWGKDPVCRYANGLFPKKDDCTKFYHCFNGKSYLKDCPVSLIFNPHLQVCDWPWNADKCGVVTNPDPTCIVSDSIKCPSSACRMADPYDCGSFYDCTADGKACKMMCPAGLKFNPIKMVCDLPENCDCTLTAPAQKPWDVKEIKPTSKTTFKPTSKPSDPCAKRSFGIVRSPTDCSKFINCASAQRIEQSCPPGTYFNEAVQICDFKTNVQC